MYGKWYRSSFLAMLVLAAAVAATLPLSASAGAADSKSAVNAPVLVNKAGSPRSPYAKCSKGQLPGSLNFTNAEFEPQVSINPTNPRNIFGAWQVDRWSDGGAHAIHGAASFDGGKSWREIAMPFAGCVPGGLAFSRISDPWVSFGGDGTLYSVAEGFIPGPEYDKSDAYISLTSTDGGRHWTKPKLIFKDVGTKHFDDKPTLTADPNRAGTAYVVWTRFVNYPASKATGPTMLSMTTDGGKTWSRARAIVPTPTGEAAQSNEIVIDPQTGALYDFAVLEPLGEGGEEEERPVAGGPFGRANAASSETNSRKIVVVKSEDGGNTWSAPTRIARLVPSEAKAGTVEAPIFTGVAGGLRATIDPQTGRLYATWSDGRWSSGDYPEVAISASSDAGATWTPPARVNTPYGDLTWDQSIAVDEDGLVGVSYYDVRRLSPTNVSTLPTTYWLKTFSLSANGRLKNASERLVDGPFNGFATPFPHNYGVGDYQGLAATGNRFDAMYVKSNCGQYSVKCAFGGPGNHGNVTDVFFRSIEVGGG